MALTSTELTQINSKKLASPNKKYYGDNEKVYIGTDTGRLRLLDKAEISPFTSTSILEETTVQGAIEELSKGITREVEVDFGTTSYQTYKIFNIIDGDVTESSKIIACKSLKSPSDGRSSDEIFAETLDISVKANLSNFDLYIKSLNGSIRGKFIILYKL